MLNNLKTILSFMQCEDRNGTWLEWFAEMQNNISTLDKDYLISVLSEWFNEGKDVKYTNMINLVNSL